jgi:hypothetical protein
MRRKKPLKRNRGLDQHNTHIPKKARQAGITTSRRKKPLMPKRAWFGKTRRRAPATPAEKAHMRDTVSLGCIACQKDRIKACPHTSIHHVREGYGAGQRASNWEVIPLGEPHHQGNLEPEPGAPKAIAFHKAERTFRARYGNEITLLKETWERLGLDFEKLPEYRGSEPPWWRAYKEGRLNTKAPDAAREILTNPMEDYT